MMRPYGLVKSGTGANWGTDVALVVPCELACWSAVLKFLVARILIPERSGELLAARFILKSDSNDFLNEEVLVSEEMFVRRTFMRCGALTML
jgi:hypothetical protein